MTPSHSSWPSTWVQPSPGVEPRFDRPHQRQAVADRSPRIDALTKESTSSTDHGRPIPDRKALPQLGDDTRLALDGAAQPDVDNAYPGPPCGIELDTMLGARASEPRESWDQGRGKSAQLDHGTGLVPPVADPRPELRLIVPA